MGMTLINAALEGQRCEEDVPSSEWFEAGATIAGVKYNLVYVQSDSDFGCWYCTRRLWLIMFHMSICAFF